jgi:hypothetical protein
VIDKGTEGGSTSFDPPYVNTLLVHTEPMWRQGQSWEKSTKFVSKCLLNSFDPEVKVRVEVNREFPGSSCYNLGKFPSADAAKRECICGFLPNISCEF